MMRGKTPNELMIEPISNEDKIDVLDGKFNEEEDLIRKATEIEMN